MSYPVTIPNFGKGATCGDSPTGSGYGFEYGGYHWAFLIESAFANAYTGDHLIHARRSNDAGATWTEVDAANAPAGSAGTGVCYFTLARDGSTLLLVQVKIPSGTATGFTIQTFDLLTATWGAIVTNTTLVPKTNIINLYQVKLIVRGAGDYILFFSGTQETVSGTAYGRAYYATFDGATFGAAVALPGQTGIAANIVPDSACADSTGRILFTYWRNSGFPSNYFAVTLSPLNVFGTVATMATGSYLGTYSDSSPPIVYTVGGVETFGFVLDSFDGTHETLIFYHAPVAANPVWVSSTIETASSADIMTQNDSGFLVPRPLGLEWANGTLVVVWTICFDIHQAVGHYRISTAPAATLVWAASANLWDSPTFSDGGVHTLNTSSSSQIAVFRSTLGVAIIGVSGVNSSQGHGSYYPSSEVAQYYFYPVLGIDCGSPPSGIVGTPYTHTFPATGATSFAITSGALPDGLTLNPATGIASGTPTAGGTFTFTVQATDAGANTASVECSITIIAPLTCGNPPMGALMIPYSHAFPPSAGAAPYTWGITGLPDGLTLDTATGIVSGTPTEGGLFPITVTVTDSLGAVDTVDCEIKIRRFGNIAL